MPYLGDLVGTIASELIIARHQVDLETKRIADYYDADPILQHFPVPHFRLPTIELAVPVIIDKIEEPKGHLSPRGGVSKDDLKKGIQQTVETKMRKFKLGLSGDEKNELVNRITNTMARSEQPVEVSVGVVGIADEASSTALSYLKETGWLPDEESAQRFSDELVPAVRAKAVGLSVQPPRLSVKATTAEVMQAGPLENLVTLHITMSEDGFEITRIDTKGGMKSRLVPE